MSNGWRWSISLVAFSIGLVCWNLVSVTACPFCDAPSTTFSEQIQTSEAVLLVEWASVVKPDPLNFTNGSTSFRVMKSLPGKAGTAKVGDIITLDYYLSGTPGNAHWMLGTAGENGTNWGLPTRMTEECWNYVCHAPARQAPAAERLRYYLNFLESSDPEIAIDAFGEFAGAPYQTLLEVRKDLSRTKLLGWLESPETTPTRLGLYGLMLGLCGNAEDAAKLESIVLKPSEDFRFGVDGMMAGYVLLTREAGFRKLVDFKLAAANGSPSETNAMLQLLRFLWEFAPDVVPQEVVKQGMRLVLNQPQFASIVIIDLARWKDWEIGPAIVGVYGQEPYADRQTRQATVRFLKLAAETPDVPGQTVLPAIQFARESLAQIRLKDPEILKDIERHPFD